MAKNADGLYECDSCGATFPYAERVTKGADGRKIIHDDSLKNHWRLNKTCSAIVRGMRKEEAELYRASQEEIIDVNTW